MNIFYLNNDVNQCAKEHVDRHVVKMIIEYAQLLSTAHRLLDGERALVEKNGRKRSQYVLKENNDIVYRASHMNHPSSKWVRESSQHYLWLYSLFISLGKEYEYRYKKKHLSILKLEEILKKPPKNLEDKGWTDPPAVMPDKYVKEDTASSYKNLYMTGKRDLASWKERGEPIWFI